MCNLVLVVGVQLLGDLPLYFIVELCLQICVLRLKGCVYYLKHLACVLELLSFSEIFHRLLNLHLLELEGLVTRVDLHLKVFNVLNQLQNLLILHV